MSDSRDEVQDITAQMRVEQSRAIVLAAVRRRVAGELLPDEVVLAEHADLMPELLMELQAARSMERSLLAGKRAGEQAGPVAPLTHDELEAPIELAGTAGSAGRVERRLVIPGYTVLEEIGRGGQAVVYRAKQTATGRALAVKVTSGSDLLNPTYRARFDREVNVLALLDHPNIVSIVDCGRASDESFFLVTDFVDGADLEKYATECRSFDGRHPDLLLEVLAKVARAVDAAHEKGVIHRDLKPSNILVDRRNEPRILDFGLAKSVDSDLAITAVGQWLGSIPWFSPEMASYGHHHADKASDIYAMGVVFYQALTGQFPYKVQGSPRDVLNRICTVVPPPMSSVWPHASTTMRAIDAVILKCLEKSPGRRYQSAGECAADIEAVIRGRRPAARLMTRTTRRRILGWLIAVLVISGTAAASWYWPRSGDVFQLPSQRNSVGMTLVEIPAGGFFMGSAESQLDWRPDETGRRVRLTRNFWLATTEVTRGQYSAVMGKSVVGGSELPMTNVSHRDATEFCRRLSEREDKQYRLPTEAEWEYAARATSRHNWDDKSIDQIAWHSGTSGMRVHRVGELAANSWGLKDMIGNVAEWCADGYGPYGELPVVDPFRSPVAGGEVVCRGGAYSSHRMEARTTWRGHTRDDSSDPGTGFRVVLEIHTVSPAASQQK